jgi:hypothetical protein
MSNAEYCERTRDVLRQIELHPSDCGAIVLDTFQALPQVERRALWAQASDADKRGLALQIIRRNGHGPSEATIALYVELLESRFGLSEVEAAIVGALSRLAQQEAQSARTARAAGLKDDAKFFQRNANAYAKALTYYLTGTRPTPTDTGWMLPSQRQGEPPHLLIKDGDWVCTCAAGESMHWAKALIVGIEVGYDDLAGVDDGEADEATEPEPAAAVALGRRLAVARAQLAA